MRHIRVFVIYDESVLQTTSRVSASIAVSVRRLLYSFQTIYIIIIMQIFRRYEGAMYTYNILYIA